MVIKVNKIESEFNTRFELTRESTEPCCTTMIQILCEHSKIGTSKDKPEFVVFFANNHYSEGYGEEYITKFCPFCGEKIKFKIHKCYKETIAQVVKKYRVSKVTRAEIK